MTALRLEGLCKTYGTTKVVETLSLAVESGEFLVLLGPSGCGKSTTLRMIAGLEEADAGRIFIGDKDVSGLPPSRRGLSMVFQSYALFPHLSVAENIVFGLKVRRVDRDVRTRRLRHVAEMVGLENLLDRKPAQLSGGQRQRVALARAIAAEHPLCLMDEPLSNLDARLRQDMRAEIRALQRRLQMTVVYVTHDQIEAMSMADRVVLLREGRVEQAGTPDELYSRPASAFVAEFIGQPPMNLLVLSDGPRGAMIVGDAPAHALREGPGRGLLLGIRPEHVRLGETGVPAHIAAVDYHGADTVVSTRIADQSVLVRVAGRFAASVGEQVRLSWSDEAVHFFEADGGCRVDLAPKPEKGNRQCSVV